MRTGRWVGLTAFQQRLGCGFPTASKHIEQFVEAGILRETTGQLRNRRFCYDPYLSLFDSPDFAPITPVEGTAGYPQKPRSED